MSLINENNNVFPHKIKEVEPDLASKLMKSFRGELTGFVKVGENGYFMPDKFKQEASNIYNMEVRDDDIFVASYPRSGTTWTQELVWMVANDLNYERSSATPLTDRYPFLEFSVFVHPKMMKVFTEENKHCDRKLKLLDAVTESGTKALSRIPYSQRRFIKTHLPLSLLPPTLLESGKVIYVARDPRDVAVSFYHLNRLIRTQGYIGDFATYWSYFIRDLHHWTPYFAHLKEAWDKRHHPNLLFLFYEEMSKDLRTTVERVSSFLGKQYTDEEVSGLCEHLKIDNFKKNPALNYDVMRELGILVTGEQEFIRKGQYPYIGDITGKLICGEINSIKQSNNHGNFVLSVCSYTPQTIAWNQMQFSSIYNARGKAGGWKDYFDKEMKREAEDWIMKNLADTDLKFPHL